MQGTDLDISLILSLQDLFYV